MDAVAQVGAVPMRFHIAKSDGLLRPSVEQGAAFDAHDGIYRQRYGAEHSVIITA